MGFMDVVKDVGKVISDFSPVISGVGGYLGAQSQQNASREMALDMQNFQERMSSTAHQREVADLRASGLNPILSTRLGGSSSPAGSVGTAVDILGSAARSGVSSALAARMNEAQVENLEENIRTQKEQQDKIKFEKAGIYENTLRTAEETKNARVLRDILTSESSSAQSKALSDKQREEALSNSPWLREIGTWLKELGISDLAGSAARIRDIFSSPRSGASGPRAPIQHEHRRVP